MTTALILGYGSSGRAMARHFLAQGAEVRIADEREAGHGALPEGAQWVRGPWTTNMLAGVSQVAVSPGVSWQHPVLSEAQVRGIPVLGEIEIFSRQLLKREPRPQVAAVTGTNGKTTVAALTAAMLNSAGVNAKAAGNIGPAALEAWMNDSSPAVWVLELSSFQLESTHSLHPAAAVLLNITEDHLDRHGDMDAYVRIKARIFEHAQVGIVNRQDPHQHTLRFAGRRVTFGLDAPTRDEDFGVGTNAQQDWLLRGTMPLIPVAQLPLAGQHGLANALAALALCDAIGYAPQQVMNGLRTFQALPHRGEAVRVRHMVTYYDDSKGTNVGATLAALDACRARGQNVVLIAGGDGKGQDFAPLGAAMQGRVHTLVVLGKDAQHIAAVAPQSVHIVYVDSMESAVRSASERAQPDDAVLLSPACSSLDMFANYAARGDAFRKAVLELGT